MDFTLLKSFIAVADERSFSRAAKHLFISQQSLSKQIAKLEEELNTPLFVRSRPLALTQDGKQFLKTAKGILMLKQQYEESSSRSMSGAHYVCDGTRSKHHYPFWYRKQIHHTANDLQRISLFLLFPF